MPDGVLCTPSARCATKVELRKKRDAEYARILRWYAAELHYRRVAHSIAGESARRRVEALIARE